jgi:hypothetical protein
VIQRDAPAPRLAVGAEQFEFEAVGGALDRGSLSNSWATGKQSGANVEADFGWVILHRTGKALKALTLIDNPKR